MLPASIRLATGGRTFVMPTLDIAYTPDSDDAFTFYAWQNNLIDHDLHGFDFRFHRDHIRELNAAAEHDRYDVVAVSSVAYPRLADRYSILAAGSSIGRGWGPVLVSHRIHRLEHLRGRRVGVGGHPTTGSTLALMYAPTFQPVTMPYDRIAQAILDGDVDAGVMIHEELLHFPSLGLHTLLDLGKAWCDDTALPLPVGLNLVHRRLGPVTARRLAVACQRSLQWALANRQPALAFAGSFGRGLAEQHVSMFSNRDTLCLPHDARQAIRLLAHRVADMNLAPRIDHIDIIDGEIEP
jgi:1,4-dihydroxy-6-naphthoate synthase